MLDSPVLFEERPTRDNGRIGVATLNSPRTLNSLSLEMVHHLEAKLKTWALDQNIVAVWLNGSGDKAFCAGGDVVALYRSLIGEGDDDRSDRDCSFAERYFTDEYQLDYQIHTYPKPLIIWGDGLVMGGGLGLMVGGFQRLVTEATCIAMPETTIGIYPDIGASWFLNKMPKGVGVYLGMTGARLNARDALDLGLADRFISRDQRGALLTALEKADYGDRSPQALRRAVQGVMDDHEDRTAVPEGQVMPRLDQIQALVGHVDPTTAVRRILAYKSDDEWLDENRTRLEAGCPLTAHLAWRMLDRHAHTSLAEAFRGELVLSVKCCQLGDFAEGVRALLIDKDKTPRWSHADVESVSEEEVQALFVSPWSSDSHPLRGLGLDHQIM